MHFQSTHNITGEMHVGPQPEVKASRPIENLGLIRKYQFKIKVLIKDEDHQIIYHHDLETDRYGHFLFKIALNQLEKTPKIVFLYELSAYPSVNLNLGTFFPLEIHEDTSKIVISDFDKTLVDTRYSTISEVWQSLKSPIDIFPTVEASIKKLKNYCKDNFHVFILSASPHFYHQAILDWLYKNRIYTSFVFLKDVRSIVSFSDGLFTTKDFKTQGFYKLNQLIQIIHLTGIPSEIVLMGDSFESDAMIYLVIYAVLVDHIDPWLIWNTLKKNKAFKFNQRQNSQFLTLFYHLHALAIKRKEKTQIKIQIRATAENIEMVKNVKFNIPFLDKNYHLVEFYLDKEKLEEKTNEE